MKGWGPALVAVGLLAACSSGSSPSVHPTASPPTSVGSTPVAIATSTPAAPTASDPTTAVPSSSSPSAVAMSYPATEAGAYAFVKALYAAQDAANHSRDASAYDALTLASCVCRSVDAYVEKLKSHHAHVAGEAFDVAAVSDFVALDAEHAQVRAAVNAASGKIVDSSGKVLETDKAASIVEVVSLTAKPTGWVVSNVHRLSRS